MLLKYLLEGLAVSFASYFVSKKNFDSNAILLLGVTAAVAFYILDTFAPQVATGARQGAGFGLGWGLVKEAFGGYEGFEGGAEAQEGFNIPYKIVDGDYAHKVLLAGFNEDVVGYNRIKLSKYPFEGIRA